MICPISHISQNKILQRGLRHLLQPATHQIGSDVSALLLTIEEYSVSVPIDWLKSPVSRGRSSSSSSSSWVGPSPRAGNTESPPTSASTMPSKLSVKAASRAAFSSSICRGRRTGRQSEFRVLLLYSLKGIEEKTIKYNLPLIIKYIVS